jgi:FkbM family methyltransferase
LKTLVHWHLAGPLLERVMRPDVVEDTERLGGFAVPTARLKPGMIAYCGGVGESIELELQLARRFAVQVHAFDPTPRSIAYIQKLPDKPQGFAFHPYGLWSSDVTLTFNMPDNPDHVSHSVVSDGAPGFDAQCRAIRSLMNELGHQKIDLLKLNIEGAEYEVLQGMLQDGVRPTMLMVAYEGPSPFRLARHWTARLRADGYKLVEFSRWTATMVRETP